MAVGRVDILMIDSAMSPAIGANIGSNGASGFRGSGVSGAIALFTSSTRSPRWLRCATKIVRVVPTADESADDTSLDAKNDHEEGAL
jgi:hypothetical protein